jgi:paraquat-inducible protein A
MGLIACQVCGQIHEEPEVAPGYKAECARCGSVIKRKTIGSLHFTAALTLCALLLYLPANLFPIMTMDLYGRLTESTVYSGAVSFYDSGEYFIALVVFLASMLIPFLKILGLLFLVISIHFRWDKDRLLRVRVFQIIDSLGRWAMLDVFALAILISLVKMQRLAHVIPGPGLLAFALVIIFTLLASWSFDPRLIWDEEEKNL